MEGELYQALTPEKEKLGYLHKIAEGERETPSAHLMPNVRNAHPNKGLIIRIPIAISLIAIQIAVHRMYALISGLVVFVPCPITASVGFGLGLDVDKLRLVGFCFSRLWGGSFRTLARMVQNLQADQCDKTECAQEFHDGND